MEQLETHLDPNSKKHQDDEIAFRASGKERRYAWDYDAEMDIFTFDEKTGIETDKHSKTTLDGVYVVGRSSRPGRRWACSTGS